MTRQHLYAMQLVCLFCICLFASRAAAQDVDRAIATLDEALANETGLSPATKSALRALVGALEAERQNGGPSAELNSMIERLVQDYGQATDFVGRKTAFQTAFPHLKFQGDFRLRHESNFDLDDMPDRHRQRLRFRFQADFAINDELNLQARLVTGDPRDPNSPHHTLGTAAFDKIDANFDRINLSYRPAWAPGLTVVAGKFGHPFATNPVYGELVWDADVQPEGLLFSYGRKTDGIVKRYDLHAGIYNVLEQGADDDAFVYVAQAAVVFALAENLDMSTSAAWYQWTDPTPEGNTALFADNAGNSLVDRDGDLIADDFASDFSIVDANLAFTWTGWSQPITLSAEYIYNARATRNDQDEGYAVGLAVGRSSKAGDWKVYYQYQMVERESVFSPVSQDDFLLQTNHESHVFGINYMITDTLGLHLWALVTSPDELGTTITTDSDADQLRLRLDLNLRF